MIQWPLEFGHNFLYITITLIEATLFTQLLNVQRWFFLGAVFWFLAWVTFAFDMRMIRGLKNETKNAKFRELLAITEQEQLLNIRVFLPLATVFYASVAGTIANRSEVMLSGQGHVLFGLLQLFGLVGYLFYSLSFYKRIAPAILASR